MQVRFKNGVKGELLNTPDCMKDFNDMFEGMRVEIESLYRRIYELRKENMRLQAENYKDEELAKMEEKLGNAWGELRRGFGISQEESEAAHNWLEKHNEKYHPNRYDGAAGGGIIYMFEPTGIGTFGTICCDRCRYKAMREAKGDADKYNKLLKEYDAEFTFQEAF